MLIPFILDFLLNFQLDFQHQSFQSHHYFALIIFYLIFILFILHSILDGFISINLCDEIIIPLVSY